MTIIALAALLAAIVVAVEIKIRRDHSFAGYVRLARKQSGKSQ